MLEVNVTIRTTIVGRISFWLSGIIIKFDLIRDLRKLEKVLNKLSCNNKVFKYKVEQGKWRALNMNGYEITIEVR